MVNGVGSETEPVKDSYGRSMAKITPLQSPIYDTPVPPQVATPAVSAQAEEITGLEASVYSSQ